MEKFLIKFFTWMGECEALEKAMYYAVYNSRIKPLMDQIIYRDETIIRLENEIARLKTVEDKKPTEPAKPKRKYNKRKKSENAN